MSWQQTLSGLHTHVNICIILPNWTKLNFHTWEPTAPVAKWLPEFLSWRCKQREACIMLLHAAFIGCQERGEEKELCRSKVAEAEGAPHQWRHKCFCCSQALFTGRSRDAGNWRCQKNRGVWLRVPMHVHIYMYVVCKCMQYVHMLHACGGRVYACCVYVCAHVVQFCLAYEADGEKKQRGHCVLGCIYFWILT